MDVDLNERLEALRADHQRVTGHPFRYFVCPVLLIDEKTALCKGHIVNQPFDGAPDIWTVQRSDVDNFYGSRFESAFLLTRHADALSAVNILSDPALERAFRPTFSLDGRSVPHFAPRGAVPGQFTIIDLKEGDRIVPVVLKMPKAEVIAAADGAWKFEYQKDVRAEAFVSVTKAAHLTLFHLLGYGYAFSCGGRFVAEQLLGSFFRQHFDKPLADVATNASRFFRPFQHMVRPIVSTRDNLRGSLEDRIFISCETGDRRPWALMVLVRSGAQLHSVLIPAANDTLPIFCDFLGNDSEGITGTVCRFDTDRLCWTAVEEVELSWPKTGTLLD